MANYGNLTYEPTTVGGQPGYRFSRPGANPVNLFGDPAEKLRLAIDQAKAAGPQKTASLGLDWDAMRSERDAGASAAAPMPRERSVSDVLLGTAAGEGDERVKGMTGGRTLGDIMVGRGASEPEKYRKPDPASTSTETAIAAGERTRVPYPEPTEQSGPSPAQRATEAAALPGQQQRQGMTGQRVRMPNGKLAEVGPDGQLYEIQQFAGQRKITKEDLEKRAGEGTLMPTAQSQRGGFERNAEFQEFVEGIRENTLNKKLIAQQALDQNLQAAEIERRAAAADVKKKQAAETERARLLQIQQDKMAEEETKYTKAREDFRTAKIDPNRMYAGGAGTLKRIGGAIAAAMGQWGSMVAGGPNNALMIIDAAIDRDIEAQKQEIATKGAEAENAMNDLIRRGMSMGQAEKTLKAAQQENTAANTRYLAAQAAPGQLQNQFAALVNELDKNTLLTEEQWRRESLGEVTKQMQAMYPQEGRAGGTVRTGTMILQEGGKGEEERPVETSTMGAFTEFQKSYEAYKRINSNPLLGDKTGNFLDVTGGTGRILTGARPAALGGEDAQNFDQDLAVGLQANRKAVTGAGASVEELARLKQDWVGQGSQREIARKSEIGMGESVQGMKNILHGLRGAERNRMLQSIDDPELRAELLK